VSVYGQTNPPGERFVFYLDSNSHLHELYAVASGSDWTDLDWETAGVPVAASGSALTSIVDNLGLVHVYYEGTSQQILEFYQLEGNAGGWSDRSPSSLADAPAAVVGSALTCLVDRSRGNNVIHVFYRGTNENVYELYTSNEGANWYSDDPTSLAGAPVAASGSALTSFIDLSNGNDFMHVFYLGTNDNVYELYWIGGGAWHSDDPTTLSGAPTPASTSSKITSFIDNTGGTASIMHVFYPGSNQNVYEMYYSGDWHSDDPTSLAGAPIAVSGSALTSFINISGSGDTGMHVMYLGANENVYALHWVTDWSYFDATTVSDGVPATPGSALTSFQDTVTGGVRLYFIGANSHVYELYWPSEGAASETDLIAASGGTAAASGSALTGVMQPN